MKALVAGLLVLAAGCSATPKPRVVPIDKETYKVESPRIGIRTDERFYVYDEATQFCATRDKAVEVVTLERTAPTFGEGTEYLRLPTAARATLLFKCVAKGPGRS